MKASRAWAVMPRAAPTGTTTVPPVCTLKVSSPTTHLSCALKEVVDAGIAGMNGDLAARLKAHHDHLDLAVLMQHLWLRATRGEDDLVSPIVEEESLIHWKLMIGYVFRRGAT